MVNVSESYRGLALAAGRKVLCRIVIGDVVYTNDDIINFEFEDVIHAEEVNWGTACANKFTFEMKTDVVFALEEQVKPYIYFEGSEEGCPLGVFYVSRRYRKRKRYTVTCYDRMYRLGGSYTPPKTMGFPSTASVIYNDIITRYGIEVADENFTPAADEITEPIKDVTVREMLGYIAGANGGCFKFNRYGQLAFRSEGMSVATITRDNYMEFSVKAEAFAVESVEFLNEFMIYAAGEGTQLTTYRMENPLGNDLIASRVFNMKSGFSYHAMDLKLKGLPYIESGDMVTLQSDVGSVEYTTIVSDYVLRFDGGLSATMTTFYKQPTEEYIPEEEPAEEDPGDDPPAPADDHAIKFLYYANRDADNTLANEFSKKKAIVSIPFKTTRPTKLIGYTAWCAVDRDYNFDIYIEIDGYTYNKQRVNVAYAGVVNGAYLILKNRTTYEFQLECKWEGDHLLRIIVEGVQPIHQKALELVAFGQYIVGHDYDPNDTSMPSYLESNFLLGVPERMGDLYWDRTGRVRGIRFGYSLENTPAFPYMFPNPNTYGDMIFDDGTVFTWDGTTFSCLLQGETEIVIFADGEWKLNWLNLGEDGANYVSYTASTTNGGAWFCAMCFGDLEYV
jgi:hypothetical protein